MNKWLEKVMYYKNTYNLTLIEAVKRAKVFYIKESEKRKFEKTFGIPFTV